MDAPAEFCLFGLQHWSSCMTKAEWSGWAQAVGATVAVLIAIAVPLWMRWSDRRETNAVALHFAERFRAMSESLTSERYAGRLDTVRSTHLKLKVLIRQADTIRLDLVRPDRLDALLELQTLADITLANVEVQLKVWDNDRTQLVRYMKANHSAVVQAADKIRGR